MTRRAAITATLAVIAALAPSASGTEGNLYESGSSIWAVGSQFSATVLSGPVWQIQAPALAPAAAGNQWEMNWGCPTPGSEIAVVRFGALRTQAPSSLALSVTGNRTLVWQEADAAIPPAAAGGRAYAVGLPPGQCNVHLALTQVETRNQHARGYFIDNPRVAWRDLTAPEVGIRGVTPGWIGAGKPVRVDWSVGDNFGSDGIATQRIVVAGRTLWSGAPGAGHHGLDIGLGDVPDGVHTLEVRADGDGTAAGGAWGAVRVDRTAPSVSALGVGPLGPPGVVSARWEAADNLSGVASTALELNTATDGSGSGAWRSVGAAHGPGVQSVTAAASGVPDGLHAWRVRATDAAGNVSYTAGPGTLTVDTAAPALELHGVPATWVATVDLDVSATDNLGAAFGPVPVEVDVNSAADGSAAGEWRRRGASAGPAGRRIVPLDLAGLDSGRHLVRVVARNGGGLGTVLATERRTTLRVDRDRPVIDRLTISGGDGTPVTASWIADDHHSGIASASIQWRDGASWKVLATEPATDGAGTMAIDVSSVSRGDRAVRIVVTDVAGNAAVRTAATTVSLGGGVGSIAADPIARLRSARLTLQVPGARASRRDRRVVLVRRVTAGRALTIRGRLADRAGRAMPGNEVQARGFRGVLAGRALTRRDGTFTLVARPTAGGPLRVGVLARSRLFPDRPSADIVVQVRPTVALAASATIVPAGQPLLFSGRITPAPRMLGLGGRKGVVLEWLDPIRRSWRPVVNARIRRDGTFAVPWTFNLRGLTIPMRVTVPAEVGWPLLPVRSGVIAVTVS